MRKATEQLVDGLPQSYFQFEIVTASTFDLTEHLVKLYGGSDVDVALGTKQISAACDAKHVGLLFTCIAYASHLQDSNGNSSQEATSYNIP